MLVLGISGSLRTGSYNTALLNAAAALLPPAARMPLYSELALVPPYSEDHDVEPAPAPVERLRSAIGKANALLVATPEYNGSIPGQLKNALDWASRPYPDNPLREKPAAVVGASTGLFGAIWAQAELRKVLTTAGAYVLEHELPIGTADEAFDDNHRLVDRELTARLEHILVELLARAVPQLEGRSGPRPGDPAPPSRVCSVHAERAHDRGLQAQCLHPHLGESRSAERRRDFAPLLRRGRVASPWTARLVGEGDQATRAQQPAELREARVRLGPEQVRVDRQDLVEGRVEGGQGVDRADSQVDHAAPDAVGVPPARLAKHQLGVVEPADVALVRDAT